MTDTPTFQSADWRYLKQEMEETVARLRTKLENPDGSYREKLVIMGEIRALKNLINLPGRVTVPLKGKN